MELHGGAESLMPCFTKALHSSTTAFNIDQQKLEWQTLLAYLDIEIMDLAVMHLVFWLYEYGDRCNSFNGYKPLWQLND